MTLLLHSCAGVQHLYVHVAHNNVAAKRLYIDRCGFKEEQHESEGYARASSRARRLLLHLALDATDRKVCLTTSTLLHEYPIPDMDISLLATAGILLHDLDCYYLSASAPWLQCHG